MSRLEDALAGLRSGGAVLLADEEREASADLVASSLKALSRLFDHGQGPVSVIGSTRSSSPANGALDGWIPDDRVAAVAASLADMANLSIMPEVAAVSADRHGVLANPGAAEGAADLLRLADIGSSALLRSAVVPGGVLASFGAAERVAKRHGFPFVTIQDVIAHRLRTETIIEDVATARLPTRYADQPLEVRALRSLIDGHEHLALIRRAQNGAAFGPEPLVRLHSECLTGDALGSLRCDCGEQLRSALHQIAEDPQGGVVIYLRGQEGRGIGLANKIRAYALQERGLDTVDANLELGFPADPRDYGVAIQILGVLGVKRLRLLSNNPRKQAALERYGIVVAERHGLRIGPNPHSAAYLETKRARMGHDLGAGLQIDS